MKNYLFVLFIISLVLFSSCSNKTTEPVENPHWSKQVSNTLATLKSVYFSNPDKGWIVGTDSTILYTENGGENWVFQDFPSVKEKISGYLSSVYFLKTNDNFGWAVGQDGKMINTYNAGTTWNDASVHWSKSYYDIFFKDDDNGWAVGISHYGSDIMGALISHTTNGGNNWDNKFFINDSFHIYQLNTIQFIDTLGYVCGDGGWLLKTSDGDSWETLDNPPGTNMRDMHFVNDSTGWILADTGIIYKTTNGGGSWIKKYELGHTLYAIFFTDLSNGWAVGINGFILHTSNGGQNWEIQKSGSTVCYEDVFFINPKVGWAIGSDGTILKYQE